MKKIAEFVVDVTSSGFTDDLGLLLQTSLEVGPDDIVALHLYDCVQQKTTAVHAPRPAELRVAAMPQGRIGFWALKDTVRAYYLQPDTKAKIRAAVIPRGAFGDDFFKWAK